MPIIIPYGPPAKTRIVCVVRFLNSSFMEQYLHTNTSKYGGTVYTINGHVNRDKLNDRSHHSYFMGYAANTGVILYWNTYQPFVIHRYYHVLFDEHNSLISIEDKHIPYYLLLQQDPEVLFIIQTSSNLFYVNLILHPLNCVIQLFSHMKLSYLLMEEKLVLIYWMMKILQYLMSLIQYHIKHTIRKIYVYRCYQWRRAYHSSSRA